MEPLSSQLSFANTLSEKDLSNSIDRSRIEEALFDEGFAVDSFVLASNSLFVPFSHKLQLDTQLSKSSIKVIGNSKGGTAFSLLNEVNLQPVLEEDLAAVAPDPSTSDVLALEVLNSPRNSNSHMLEGYPTGVSQKSKSISYEGELAKIAA